jgi:hemerythrin superfamily protein
VAITDSNQSVIDLLVSDHRKVEQLLGRFDVVPTAERGEYFCEVVHELVRHEMAEELVVYPALRSDAPDGPAQADARIREQAEAEQMLDEMEHMDPASQEFGARFLQLRHAVLQHANAEESQAFPLLGQTEDASKLMAMGQRYEKAKAKAPTHPHPHAPDTPPGNKLLGPIAAMLDKARDSMSRV